MRLNVTRPWLAARVALEAKGKTLYEEKIDIAPDRPYARDLRLPRNTAERDLVLSLFAADGKQLLSFSPEEHRPPDDPMPEPLKPPPAPKDIQTVEELYLAGLRLNQFYNASLDPAPYYEEALKRDPGDYRVNTQLGILAIRNLHWKEAEERLRTAVNRITANYTRSRDGEAQYYLGVALRAQGKIGEATDRFYEASWSAAWQTPAHTQLAEIECGRRDYETALDHADRAIATHAGNLKALGLKTIVLRKSGRTEEAERQALLTAGLDPLDHLCRNELFLIRSAAGRDREASAAFEDLRRIMRGDVQSYLELATDYGNCGCDKEAVDILSRLEDEGETYPMVYYLLGYYWSRLGDSRKAGECFRTANRMPHAYCFPSRAEEMAALECAMRVNPGDARASYYLGDLMYELQPAKAVEAWETSRSLDSTFYTVHRNLGLAYEKVQNDVPKAVLSMEKAVACNPADPRLLYELDVLYEKARVSPEKRHALLRTFQATAAGRSETLLRQATLSVQVGRYEEALDILANNFFPQWEGGREMQEATLNAYLLRGLERFDAGKAGEALLDFRTALAYPLERWGRSRIAQFHYLVGTACEALGLADSASIHYQKTIKADIGERDREYAFYHGMAQKKLNRAEDARKTFEDLLAAARKESGEDFFRQFEAGRSRDMQMAANHYVAGLAYIGLEDAPRAKNELEQAVALDPGLVWAKRYLASLGGR
jgi:tetratricopeptide (TPR) repeat protein